MRADHRAGAGIPGLDESAHHDVAPRAMHPDHEVNRASWDQLAAVHGQDAYYDSRALIAGASSLIEEEERALGIAVGGALSGRSVLHVQCHIGFDAITFARRGAKVTGVDFSPVALAHAASLAEQCGVQVEWVCADAIALPEALEARFDLAWATIGVLCWIADVRAWMASVARTLAPGGRLVLIDGHPLRGILESGGPGTVSDDGRPVRIEHAQGCDYASDFHTGPQVEFHHTLGETVTAAADAGLRISLLREHLDLSHHLCNDQLRREVDGRYRHRVGGHPAPVLFTLVAER
jgi:SAM-dependent methyltransferase